VKKEGRGWRTSGRPGQGGADRKVISDQISAIRRQEKAYAEVTENAEFAEKKNPSVRRRGVVALERKNPPLA